MEKFLNSILMENQQIIEQPIELTTLMDKLTQFSVNFIKNQAINGSSPFALYHAFTSVHTPLSPAPRFRGKSSHGLYGDRYEEPTTMYFFYWSTLSISVIEMDEAIGKILAALKEANAEKNTLVYFTSDHGADTQLGLLGGSNAGLKGCRIWKAVQNANSNFLGGKGMDTLEGGIRVPGIIKWPKVIKPNTVIEVPTSHLDFTPTLRSIVVHHGSKKVQAWSNPQNFFWAGGGGLHPSALQNIHPGFPISDAFFASTYYVIYYCQGSLLGS